MNRRIHAIPEWVWRIIFETCREVFRDKNISEFIIDSFPVPSCQNYKIFCSHLFPGEKHRGYSASKKIFFWGIKIHMIIALDGFPMEFIFTPGSTSDVKALKDFNFESIQEDAIIYGDKAYNDYHFEDLLTEERNVNLVPKRKNNSKRRNTLLENFNLTYKRNKIETTFSCITGLMPKTIRARTERGFCLKVFFFILGYIFNSFAIA